jgi:hypothetical protein
MAITPGTITATSGAAGTTGNTLVIHSSVQAGDILLLGVTNRDGTADPTVVDNEGAGSWAKVSNQNAATNGSLSVWWKRASANTASKTITISGGTGSVSSAVTPYRGALAAGTPYGTPVPESNASGNVSTAGITTSAAGSFVCLFVGVTSNDTLNPNTYVATDPATLTERAEGISTSGSDCSMSHASAERATAGATGTISWSQTAGTGASIVFELKTEPVAATGTTSVTQAANTAAGTATVAISGTASLTQAANTVVATATVGVTATASTTQDAQSVVGTAAVTEAGTSATASVTQAAQAVTANAAVGVSSSAALTQAAHGVSATALVGVAATATITQAAQSSAGTGAVLVGASAALTQATNAVSGTAAIGVSGSAALTQAAQTATASAAIPVTSSASLAQAAQTSAASAVVTSGPTGSAALTQAANALTSSASVGVLATLNITQDAHVVAATATALTQLEPVTATVALVQADHVATSSAAITSNQPKTRKHARAFAPNRVASRGSRTFARWRRVR